MQEQLIVRASGRNPDDKVGNDFLRKTQSQKRFASLRLHASSFFQELKKEPKKPLSVTTGVFVYREFYDRCISARCAVTLGC